LYLGHDAEAELRHVTAAVSNDLPELIRQPAPKGSYGGEQTRDVGRRSVWLHLGVVGLLCGLAILAWWRVWITGHPTSTMTCTCGDPSQELWLFAWTPFALGHGLNPFFTNFLEAGQGGVNVMWDANNFLASLILSPITVLFGPIASFNVAALLAPVLSGWCFFLAVGRITRFVPGQIAGALLYGFSPFVIWNSPYGHINLTWLFFPPLTFLLIHDLVLKPRRRSAVIGLQLAGLVILQFFVGTEVLVISGIGLAIGGVIAVAACPRRAWALRRRLLVAATWTVLIAGCALAYPAWFTAFGPRHIVGSPWSRKTLETQVVDPPTILFAKNFHQGNALQRVFGYYGAIPPILYLGIGLLAFLAVSALVWHRDRLAWIILGTGVFATLLSFGTTTTQWWLPWHYFEHVPLLEDVQAIRFAIIAGFASALLLSIYADRWWQYGKRFSDVTSDGPRTLWLLSHANIWGILISVILGGLLWSITDVYELPFVVHNETVPVWFTRDGPRLHPNTKVLALPTDFPTVTNVMSWQAEAGLPFALEGGYAVIPRSNQLAIYSLAPRGGARILDNLSQGLPQPLSLVPEVRTAIRRWGVGVVIMRANEDDPAHEQTFFTHVLGRPPNRVGTWWVWTVPARTQATP
jgi:hypothetical protein